MILFLLFSVPGNNDCDFEKPCLWTISSTGNFTWLLNRGYTQSFHTGPSFDLTLGSNRGHYVYTESSFGNINDKAWLISGNIVPIGSEGGCLSFWYHRYGEGIGPLRVKFKVSSNRK